MSDQILKYTINEILSLFTPSDPPEFLCDIKFLFVEESRTPIANYPKNLSNITVAPKNTNLKVTKSEPTRNEHENLPIKVSDFSPKLISKQNDKKIQKNTEFIPSFKPVSTNSTDKNNTSESSSLVQNIEQNDNFETNSNVDGNLTPTMDNSAYIDAPIFVPQGSPSSIPQNPPIFVPQSPAPFSPEILPTFYPQFPPGFCLQDYPFYNNFSPFSPQYSYPPQIPNQNLEQINQTPETYQDQHQNIFNSVTTPIQEYSNNSQEQMDGFESVIDAAPDLSKNASYTNNQDEYIFNAHQQLPPIASSQVPSNYIQQQYQPQQYQEPQEYQQIDQQPPQYHQIPQPYQQQDYNQFQQQEQQQHQEQDQEDLQQYQHQDQTQYQQPQEQQQNKQQQQHHQQKQPYNQTTHKRNSNKDYQNNYNQKKNENKSKNTFSPDTVVEDVKNVKITPWGNAKSKTSQQSFQEIEESAKSDELSNQYSSKPIALSSSKSPQSSSSKFTITNIPNNKNEGGKNKKGNRNPYLSRPTEIPKPANFTVDNIAISQVTNATLPPKPVVVYNKNFSSISNSNTNSTYNSNNQLQIQNTNRSKSFSITTQSNNTSKPDGFSPGNIAVPPNFANNFFPS